MNRLIHILLGGVTLCGRELPPNDTWIGVCEARDPTLYFEPDEIIQISSNLCVACKENLDKKEEKA